MRVRRGQVAVYLLLALVAIGMLLVINVNVFLAVRAKNRMMNAVDKAAVAVAWKQAQLLNEIGQLNVEHLRRAVLGLPRKEDYVSQIGLRAFLYPLDGLDEARRAAAQWIVMSEEPSGDELGLLERMKRNFSEHAAEIRNNPDLYASGDAADIDKNPWMAYADRLDSAIDGHPIVLPYFMEAVNPGASGLFANRGLYDAVAAKAWCWFTVGSRRTILDQDLTRLEAPELVPRLPENSEVFSLHVRMSSWEDSPEWESAWNGSFNADWTNFVCWVTGLRPENFATNEYATASDEAWAFYDDSWRRWSDTFHAPEYPIEGAVVPEYDVAGCFSSCMMAGVLPRLAFNSHDEDAGRSMLVTAEAKPLGTVEDVDGGGAVPVTAYGRFIAQHNEDADSSRPIFTDAQLVLMGAVPRTSGLSMEPGWYEHLKRHQPSSLDGSCGWCRIWRQLIDQKVSIRNWVDANQDGCRPHGKGGERKVGGYDCAH